jgi:hypothetical protein
VRILIAICNRPVRRVRSANERNDVEKVIRALAHLKTTHPRKKKLFPSLLSFAATVTACAMPKRKTCWHFLKQLEHISVTIERRVVSSSR